MMPPRNDEAGISSELTRPQIKTTTGGFSGNHPGAVKPDLLAAHFCVCKPGAVCIFCLQWSRRIHGIVQRREDGLRRQVLNSHTGG